MSHIMQPLSERFLYCSPEAMRPEFYRTLQRPAASRYRIESDQPMRREHGKKDHR